MDLVCLPDKHSVLAVRCQISAADSLSGAEKSFPADERIPFHSACQGFYLYHCVHSVQ